MEQFQEQENPMQTFVNSYKLSPAVQSLLEGGPKNARVLQRRVQELVISEKMAALTGPQDLSAACFTDPREAFECIIAQLKMGAQPSEFEQTALEPLAVWLYRQEQMALVGKRALGFGVLIGFMCVAPWIAHKLGFFKKNPTGTK